MIADETPDGCAIVIFGASGDLTFRKLIPSLFDLDRKGLLPKGFRVLGAARTPMSDSEFREKAGACLPEAERGTSCEGFLSKLGYQSGAYDDAGAYRTLGQRLERLDAEAGLGRRRLFYLSTPPSLYETIIGKLGEAGLNKTPGGWVRIVIEKPFGTDGASAAELDEATHRVFRESQVYRIDHYLGKETVQNILMFRFANTLFEPVWNRNYIDHVQITNAESLGIEHRAGYYEQAGVLRDMFQNHLFQLMSLIAMEPPSRLEAGSVRNEKVEVLQAVRPVAAGGLGRAAVRGQYAGYRREDGVSPASTTPTFAALRLEIDNWRWQGVPFYLRSGKSLAQRVTEIAVQFRQVPVSIFQPLFADQIAPNLLRLRIQPEEGVSMRFEAKRPGPKVSLASVAMDFDYQKTFGQAPPEAYGRLFLDAMVGDQTLFARSDGVEEAWRILDPVLRRWEAAGEKGLATYSPGTWGPPESDELLKADGRRWVLP